MVRMGSRSTSRSRSRERVDRFGRVIPRDKKRSRSRSRDRDRHRRRSRSRSRHSGRRSRSRSHSRGQSSRHSYSGRKSPDTYGGRDVSNRTNIEDPRFLNARVFIGNLPVDKVSKAELETMFQVYGKILGVSIHDRGFGFVQFEKDDDAKKAVESENGSLLKGNRLDVKMAAEGRRGARPQERNSNRDSASGAAAAPPPRTASPYDRDRGGYSQGPPPARDRSPVRGGDPYEDRYRDARDPYARREPPPGREPPPPPVGRRDERDPYYPDPYRRPPPPDDPYGDRYRDDPYRRDPYRRDPYDDPYRDPYREPYRDPYGLPPPPPKKAVPIDVQIVCMNAQLRSYAESIDSRLHTAALISDITVIPENMGVSQMVEEAQRKNSLFAIIINTQNEQHKSLTLNILHGTPQEHRNMPLDDAVDLVVSSFESYIQSQREKAAAPTPGARAAPPPFVPPSSDVSYLLNLLADNRQLTVEEIEKVIEYLQERKSKMLVADGRQPAPIATSTPRAAPVPPVNQLASAASGDTAATNQAFLQQQQQELQAKILSILNGSSTATTPSVGVQGVQAQSSTWAGGATAVAAPRGPLGSQQQSSGGNPLINFDNPNVQKALDNLIQSGPNLLKNIPASPSNTRQGFGSAPGSSPASRAPLSQQTSPQQGYAGYQQQQQQQQQGAGVPRMMGYGAQQSARPMNARTPQQPMRPRY